MHVTTSPGTSKHDEGHTEQNGRHNNSTTCLRRRHLHKHPSPKLQTTAGITQQLTNLLRPFYPMVQELPSRTLHCHGQQYGIWKWHLCRPYFRYVFIFFVFFGRVIFTVCISALHNSITFLHHTLLCIERYHLKSLSYRWNLQKLNLCA